MSKDFTFDKMIDQRQVYWKIKSKVTVEWVQEQVFEQINCGPGCFF